MVLLWDMNRSKAHCLGTRTHAPLTQSGVMKHDPRKKERERERERQKERERERGEKSP